MMGKNEEDLDPKLSIISNLLKQKYPFNGSTIKSVAVQTSPQEVGYTLEQRLALIDQQYRKNVSAGADTKDEMDFKKKLDQIQADLKHNYQRDIERFKEFESHSIKVKVSQQWRKKFEDYSNSIA